jgi:hypothetical protein
MLSPTTASPSPTEMQKAKSRPRPMCRNCPRKAGRTHHPLTVTNARSNTKSPSHWVPRIVITRRKATPVKHRLHSAALARAEDTSLYILTRHPLARRRPDPRLPTRPRAWVNCRLRAPSLRTRQE